jgi:DNA-directed RNA polymerase subunit M/transcription elongation factor TFIIS
MASTITIICPECEKSIKAPEDIVGKKIRCKGCGETFTAKAPKGGKPVKRAAAKKDENEEEEGSYGVTEEYLGPRCPDCANAMEEGEVICLHCGYNTITREKPKQRKVRETTGGDIFLWLLPGIFCVLLIIGLITAQLMYILLIDMDTFGGEDAWLAVLGGPALKVWSTVFTLFMIFAAGSFAVKRLIFDNTPPEIEEKWVK